MAIQENLQISIKTINLLKLKFRWHNMNHLLSCTVFWHNNGYPGKLSLAETEYVVWHFYDIFIVDVIILSCII